MTTEKKLHRIEFHHESVEERVKHFHEFKTPLTAEEIHEQALRCLHCGTPYCSSSCPLHNRPGTVWSARGSGVTPGSA